MAIETTQKIIDGKIIAIVRGVPSDRIVDLATAMHEGGISCVEVTFDQSSAQAAEDTLLAISKLSKHFGEELCIGAGTVMTAEQVCRAADAGAKYMISPNIGPTVIEKTKQLGLVSIPGAFTPTEVAYAYSLGADIVKLFPAGILGPAYIKALKAPLKHIPMTAVGGVNAANCADFINAGCVGVGVGGNLVNKTLVAEGRFEEITAEARKYEDALKSL